MSPVAEIAIRGARQEDLPFIKELLLGNDLPMEGVDEHWRTFLLAWDHDRLVGCGGAEAYTNAALLRSIAVDHDYRSQGIARTIVRQLLDRLSSRGIRDFYLLTTSAEQYFAKRGFKRIEWDEVNPQVLASSQFQGACPTS